MVVLRIIMIYLSVVITRNCVRCLSISTSSSNSSNSHLLRQVPRVAIIGGGASGMFAGCAAAHDIHSEYKGIGEVIVYEATQKLMSKVAISGGGRCNVLHDTKKSIPTILEGYPRGKRELTGVFHGSFSPTQAEQWFTTRGVKLKTEDDGRMFPVTDSSSTIIDTINSEAKKLGVEIRKGCKIMDINIEYCKDDNHQHSCFRVTTNGKTDEFQSLIIATGSSVLGYKLAQSLGHKIVKTVPSLFTLSAKEAVEEGGVFEGLAGLSVQNTRIEYKFSVEGRKKKQVIFQEGPLLITHKGISGPAPLRLSAFAARQLFDNNYTGEVTINWIPEFGNVEDVERFLWELTTNSPKKNVSTVCPFLEKKSSNGQASVISKRLWSALVCYSDIPSNLSWSEMSKKRIRKLAHTLTNSSIKITGKGVFKEEFVTAGGVSLKEVDMKQMMSRKCPGLFFCGEVLDVDGITGGYNFMNCWSTGYVAGRSAASFSCKVLEDK